MQETRSAVQCAEVIASHTKAEASGAWSCVRKSVDLNQTMAVDAPTAERAVTADTAFAADIDVWLQIYATTVDRHAPA
jgi:hypothetical protein